MVRTMTSLALHLVNQFRANEGLPGLQLMMGTRQDEILREVVAETTITSTEFDPDAMQGIGFRTELRDLWRVLDDFDLTSFDLFTPLQTAQGHTEAAAWIDRWGERWQVATQLLDRARKIAETRYPRERTSSGMLREATQMLNRVTVEVPQIPRLILVDNAVELGEGEL